MATKSKNKYMRVQGEVEFLNDDKLVRNVKGEKLFCHILRKANRAVYFGRGKYFVLLLRQLNTLHPCISRI